MSVIKLSNRYAKSLLALALDKDKLEEVHQDIVAFRDDCADNKELVLMLKSPVIDGDDKMNALSAIFGEKSGSIFMIFLKGVIEKHREYYLPDIATRFIHLYSDYKNIMTAKLITAIKVNDDIIQRFKRLLEKETNKEVILNTVVDNNIIGGFVLHYEDKRYDASIEYQLDILRNEFNDNEYIKKF